MPDPLDYIPPHRDRIKSVTSAERILAGLVVAAFLAFFAWVIWLLIRN